jgi:hypothetical protein
MGEYGKAVALFEEAKAVAEEVGDRVGVGLACANLGECFYSIEEYGKACMAWSPGFHNETRNRMSRSRALKMESQNSHV